MSLFLAKRTVLPEWAGLALKILVTLRSVVLSHVLVVAWDVFIVFLASVESHYKGVVGIEEMAEHANLRAGDFGKSYHICVIAYIACWSGLMPAGLWNLAQLI